MKTSKTIKPALLRASIGLFAFIILLTGTPAQAATLFVSTGLDESTGFSCSLREAVNDINMGMDGNGCGNFSGDPYGTNDTINIWAFTIILDGNLGEIDLKKDVTIQGQGYSQTIIDATNITSGAAIVVGPMTQFQPFVTMSGLTLQNSKVTAITVANGTLEFSYGKILNSGTFNTFSGGCIENRSNLYVESSELQGCKAQQGGGIADTANFTFLYVYNTTIDKCRAIDFGGAIYHVGGDAEIINSTLANNDSNTGGGIYTSANASSSYLYGVTIAYNETFQPGTGALTYDNLGGFGTPNLTITGSIVAKNINGAGQSDNCRAINGSIISQGYNILGDQNEAHCPGGVSTDHYADPNFMTNAGMMYTFFNGKRVPLPSAAGGVGPVYIPNHGSPATSLVPTTNSFCFPGNLDERSVNRIKDGNSNCDIGAASRSSALFVVANPGGLSHGDTVVKNTLSNLGFDVTTVDGNTVTSGSASRKAIVVVSNSVAKTNLMNVPATFRDVTAGVMVMNPSLYFPMQMTGMTGMFDFGSTGGQTTVIMADQGTFSGPFFGFLIGDRGAPPVTTSGQTYGWGVPAAGSSFEDDADMSNNLTHSAIFSFSMGSQMYGTFVAPGTRVGFFASEGAANALTPQGQRLLQQAILRTAEGSF
ncbi:MAG TPA: hypothetical protein VK699_14900 [Terriglobales bacterium]|nr:hypothetical protein [Terriglobales bacterium]